MMALSRTRSVLLGIALIAMLTSSISMPWHRLLLPTSTLERSVLHLEQRVTTPMPHSSTMLERATNEMDAPLTNVSGYIRPEFLAQMQALRPAILAAAKRHNRPTLSSMSDEQFAEAIALVLYNEHDGWLEDDIEALRPITPLYQQLQIDLNESGLGSNFSVWPANLRPSVGLEMLHQQLPVPLQAKAIAVPVQVYGSKINPQDYSSKRQLFAAITSEIQDNTMAVEYLAANLERGVYRAHYERVPVSWRALAAWHNQGLVRPQAIQRNATARSYVQRCALYLEAAHDLIHTPPVVSAHLR